jgi:hypothetical protein
MSKFHGIKTVPDKQFIHCWEHMESSGIAKTFLKVTFKCLFSPSAFFKSSISSDNIFMAWIYAALAGGAGIMFNYLWINILPISFPGASADASLFFSGKQISAMELILFPATLSLELLLIAAYSQFMMRLFSKTKPAFKSAFNIVCYAQAPMLLNIIPVSGPVIAAIWSMYLIISGQSVLYGKSRIKTFMILSVPILTVSIILVFLLLAAVFAGMAAGNVFKGLPFFFR